MPGRFVWRAVFCLLSHAAIAGAAPSNADLSRARQLFKEATELEANEEWAAAESKLREALEIKETPGLRFHLAHALESAGKLIEAEQEYARCAELIAAGAKAPDVEKLIEPAREALRERTPTLTVTTASDADITSWSLDGVPLSPELLGEARSLNPGEYRLTVQASGYRAFESRISLREGERRQVRAELEPLVEQASPAPPEERPLVATPNDEGSGIGARELVVAAEILVAAGALGFGIYNLVERGAAVDTVREKQAAVGDDVGTCHGSLEPDCVALRNAASDYDRANTLAIVGFAASGIAAGAAVATYLLWPKSEPATAVHVIPVRGGVMSGVRLRF